LVDRLERIGIQFSDEFVLTATRYGFILAIILIVVFLILWLSSEKNSGTPCGYALGSFIAFYFAITFVQGGPRLPPHTPVCSALGWFLVVMSIIQAFYEVTRNIRKENPSE
jgi:hypothetical protein